jgi:hypothetical protein
MLGQAGGGSHFAVIIIARQKTAFLPSICPTVFELDYLTKCLSSRRMVTDASSLHLMQELRTA